MLGRRRQSTIWVRRPWIACGKANNSNILSSYWVFVEVDLQIANKLTVNVLRYKPYKWAVLLASTSRNLEYFIVETKFVKDQVLDRGHLHRVRLSAIFALVPTLVHTFLPLPHLAIVELSKKGKIHTEEVQSKQKLKRTKQELWILRR